MQVRAASARSGHRRARDGHRSTSDDRDRVITPPVHGGRRGTRSVSKSAAGACNGGHRDNRCAANLYISRRVRMTDLVGAERSRSRGRPDGFVVSCPSASDRARIPRESDRGVWRRARNCDPAHLSMAACGSVSRSARPKPSSRRKISLAQKVDASATDPTRRDEATPSSAIIQTTRP
jgi:hypothetical protein